jgi:hypothetical protein
MPHVVLGMAAGMFRVSNVRLVARRYPVHKHGDTEQYTNKKDHLKSRSVKKPHGEERFVPSMLRRSYISNCQQEKKDEFCRKQAPVGSCYEGSKTADQEPGIVQSCQY